MCDIEAGYEGIKISEIDAYRELEKAAKEFAEYPLGSVMYIGDVKRYHVRIKEALDNLKAVES